MPQLSSTYRRALIERVMKLESDDVGEILKKLVLSSPEMSHAFAIMMENIVIEYSVLGINVQGEKGEEVSYIHSQSAWLVPFTRNLKIFDYRDDAAVSFLDTVLRTNNLVKLDVSYLIEELYSQQKIQNLMSITRRLQICASSLHKIPNFLPRCETVFFYSEDDFEFKPFMQVWNSDSSIALEMQELDLHSPVRGFLKVLTASRALLQHVRRFYFTWQSDHDIKNIEKLITFLKEYYPNIEELIIGIELELVRPNFSGAEVFWKKRKDDFDRMAAALRQIPPQMKANVFFVTDSECPNDIIIARHFLPEDFIVTSNNGILQIDNRQKKLTENVEYSYFHHAERSGSVDDDDEMDDDDDSTDDDDDDDTDDDDDDDDDTDDDSDENMDADDDDSDDVDDDDMDDDDDDDDDDMNAGNSKIFVYCDNNCIIMDTTMEDDD